MRRYKSQVGCHCIALFRLADGAEVNSQLLAFFVEMAAFEAEGFRGVGHVVVVQLQFFEQGFAFEGFDALRERAGAKRGGKSGSARIG